MSKRVTGSVFIVDDDADFGLSMQWFIESCNYPAYYFSDTRTFLDSYKGEMGCMLLNPSMPNTDGLTLMETMRTRNIHLPVIMISGQSDIPQVVAAIKAGALDYIPKPCDQNTVLSVVESGLQLASEQHQEQQRTATTRNNYQLLSRREKQVMELVVNGYANREIAESLGISPKTVEVHRSRVMGKMQANSLPALVNFAMELGKQNKAELA